MDPDDLDIDELLRGLDDVPELERLGIFTGYDVDHHPPFAAVAARLAELRAADEPYVDEHGYTWQVTAAAVDEAEERAAWVEWKERGERVVDVHYVLKARDRHGILRWEIETYNPYFGCRVGFLGWRGDAVVLVYADKHDTFAASLAHGRPVRRVEITPGWSIEGDTLTYREGESMRRVALPSLEIDR